MLTVRRQQHSFSTHERMFLWKCQSFWDRKCRDLRGTRTPNLRIHAECSNHLSYRGHAFATPCFWISALVVCGILYFHFFSWMRYYGLCIWPTYLPTSFFLSGSYRYHWIYLITIWWLYICEYAGTICWQYMYNACVLLCQIYIYMNINSYLIEQDHRWHNDITRWCIHPSSVIYSGESNWVISKYWVHPCSKEIRFFCNVNTWYLVSMYRFEIKLVTWWGLLHLWWKILSVWCAVIPGWTFKVSTVWKKALPKSCSTDKDMAIFSWCKTW